MMIHVISGQLDTSPIGRDGTVPSNDELVKKMIVFAASGFES